jgi:glycosyltransferase involved in cell wall biosynthesis
MIAPVPGRVLMLYLEPAPYVVGLVRALRQAWGGRIDVLYAAETLTQPWGGWRPEDDDAILPAGRAAAARILWRRLDRRSYDLVHLAGWGHPLLLGALLLAAVRRVPVTIESDTHVVSAGSGWKDALKRLIYPQLFRIPRVFLPGGSPQASYLRAFGVASSRIEIAQMTSDVAAIDRYIEGRGVERSGRGPARFLYLGRLEPHKGVADLLLAFGRLRKTGIQAELLVAGGGSLSGMVAEAAAADSAIHYLGHLSGERVWDAYTQADVFVLPSRVEPWGLVVNEAMAAGLPVIVTDRVGSAADLVEKGVTGIVVPGENVDELERAMKALASDAVLRGTMGSAAKAAIQGWTLDEAAARTIGAWRRAAP